MNNLATYLASNQEVVKDFKISQNTITYNGEVLDLTDLDIEKFLHDNVNFIRDIAYLPSEDVFRIIKIHVTFAKMLKAKEDKKAKPLVEEIINSTPSLKNFKLFQKFDNFGNKKYYLHFVDDDNKSFVLPNVTAKDFYEAHTQAQAMGKEVIKQDIVTRLSMGREYLKLENLFDAELRKDTSEEHLNNLKNLHDKNINSMENHNEVFGNEEHAIYINNGEIITTYTNSEGKKITERHGQKESEENVNEDVIIKTEEDPLITFDEYSDIILNRESLNEEETKKTRNFESFLFDVITYKEYLTDDLHQVHEQYESFYAKLNEIDYPNEVIESTKTRYQDMELRSNEKRTTMEEAKKQVQGMTRMLTNQVPYDKAGSISAVLFALLVVIAGIAIGVITVLAK